MLKCDKCNGSARVAHGFFTIVCDQCDSGTLTVNKILRLREKQNKNANDFRLLIWKDKMLKRQLQAGI